jgi:hypothetical protein
MSKVRVYTHESRESAVGLALSQGLSIRLAAEDLAMPYHNAPGNQMDTLEDQHRFVLAGETTNSSPCLISNYLQNISLSNGYEKAGFSSRSNIISLDRPKVGSSGLWTYLFGLLGVEICPEEIGLTW